MCMTFGTSKNFKFPNYLKVLEEKNIIIANSVATYDSTPHEASIKMIQNGKSGDSITNASGYDMASNYF